MIFCQLVRLIITYINMKKKIRSSSKPSSPISRLRGAIGQKKTKTLRLALSTFKKRGAIERFPQIYAQAVQNPIISQILPATRRISNMGVLGFTEPLDVATLSREIQWAAVASYISHENINIFVAKRLRFFQLFTAGDFQAASHVLDEITEQCGESVWAIENRIVLLSVWQGFEAQKKYVQLIGKEQKRSNIAFLSSSFGERNESRVSFSAFAQRLRNRSKSWNITEEHRNYFLYKLANLLHANEANYATVLAHEGSCSAIDLYEALLDIVRRASSQQFFDEISAVSALDFAGEGIVDQRILELREYILGERKSIDTCESTVRYTSHYLNGDYEAAKEVLSKHIATYPADMTAVDIYSRILAIMDSRDKDEPDQLPWLAQIVSRKLTQIYRNEADLESAVDELTKLSNNMRHSDFSLGIQFPVRSMTYQNFYRRTLLQTESGIYQEPLLPPRFESETGVGDGTAHIPERLVETYNFELMHSLFEEHRFEEALEYAQTLESSSIMYFSRLGSYYASHILAKTLRIEEALEKSVRIFIDNPGAILFTPLVSIIKERGYRDLKGMASSPSLAAAFYIYAQVTGRQDKEVALKISWKTYLKNQGIDCPSKLRISDTASSVEIFFLWEVCKQETMELGGAFSSQLDLDRERQQICINLAQYDEENSDVYDQEIVALTRRIKIEEGVEYLESSRIFVDEIGAKNWAKKNLESQFLRYIDFLKAGLFSSVKELEQIIIKIASTSKNRKADLTSYLDSYDISAESLLEEILGQLANAFLSLPRYGLDAFLSSRVRHGSFVGYLRGPLEDLRLITKKGADGRYQDNDYILNSWNVTNQKERRICKEKLATFSESIDNLLDEAVSKYLHVNSKAKPEGMVTFKTYEGDSKHIAKRWLLSLKSTLSENSSIEELTSYCFQNFFWPAVEASLTELQRYVNDELANRVHQALKSLENGLAPNIDPSQRHQLYNLLYKTKYEMGQALRRVSLWFDTPKKNAQTLTMTLEMTFEIGLQAIMKARPHFSPEVHWRIEDGANINVHGPAIALLNDYAFLVFGNVYKHSGFEIDTDRTWAPAIDVEIAVKESSIEIVVVSEISENKDLALLQNRMDESARKIALRDFDSVAQQTDGTGLIRLAQGSHSADGADHKSLEFKLDAENRKFHVSFSIARGLIEAER